MFRSHQQLEGGIRIDKLRESPHWSYSAMQCYLTCPLKYKFRYIDNAEPERTGSCFPFGRAFHAALSERARIGKDMSTSLRTISKRKPMLLKTLFISLTRIMTVFCRPASKWWRLLVNTGRMISRCSVSRKPSLSMYPV